MSAAGKQTDILEVIADLSSDEVRTSPRIVNQVLDMLPQDVWRDETLRWLDPGSKTGSFLREITKRLLVGLEDKIPDKEERLTHILKNMVFGIAVTADSALMSRRTLYCSKDASGEKSIVRMDSPDGNLVFADYRHDFINGKCVDCRAQEKNLDQTHAYAFIHRDGLASVEGDIGMQFDVIVGNPPYHMTDGGGEGASAIPLYHRFVDQAKSLNPKYIAMIIPARWYSGGKGLGPFRDSMLGDGRIVELHDYPETKQIFPDRNIRGGICYFLWDAGHTGTTRVVNHLLNGGSDEMQRPLLEDGLSTFIRFNQAISILNKVRGVGEEVTVADSVQSRNPFGISSDFKRFSTKQTLKKPVLLYRSRRGQKTDREVFIDREQISSNAEWGERLKVIVSKVSPGGDEYPHAVLGEPIVSKPGSVSTETYLIIAFPKTEGEAKNLTSYMKTRFFRFLVLLRKTGHNLSKASFEFVPAQDLSTEWTDEKLYEKYGISKKEQAFIEELVRGKE
jgi:site-specific DNA-methyltransferase (adenine-specific)